MHTVTKNLKIRQDKKAPFEDGRKIVLVLYGGNMLGIRTTAALLALEKMGLSQAFDKIFAVSAGVPQAAYFLAEQISYVFPMYTKELASRKFINFWRLTRMVDMNYLLKLMQKEYKLDVDKIFKSKTELSVRFRNIKANKLEYFKIQDHKQDFWKIMEASVSLPFFNPGRVKFNGSEYMDTIFYTDNLLMHLEKAIDSDATDILVLYNHHGQIKKDNKGDDSICELYLDPDPKMGHFTRNQKKLLQTAQDMCDLVTKEFEYEKINLTKI